MGVEWSLQNTYSILLEPVIKRGKKFNLLNFTNVNKFSNIQKALMGGTVKYGAIRCGTPYCARLGDRAARVQCTLRTIFSSGKLKVSEVTQHYLY